jgi:hypothetical protein
MVATRFAGRVAEAMRVSAVPASSAGQMSPAGLLSLAGSRMAGKVRRSPSRKRRAAAAPTYRKKSSAKRAKAGKQRLVKGSAAAKAWGRKMARARRR